jgi:hypothetical protein
MMVRISGYPDIQMHGYPNIDFEFCTWIDRQGYRDTGYRYFSISAA